MHTDIYIKKFKLRSFSSKYQNVQFILEKLKNKLKDEKLKMEIGRGGKLEGKYLIFI